MKSLEQRFNKIAERNPLWGSYVCFAESVRGQGFNREVINRWFKKRVNKNDYARGEKRALLENLVELTKPLRRIEIKAKVAKCGTVLRAADIG